MIARVEGSVNLALAIQSRHEEELRDIKSTQHNQAAALNAQASTLAAHGQRLDGVEKTVSEAKPVRVTPIAVLSVVIAALAVLLTIADKLYT